MMEVEILQRKARNSVYPEYRRKYLPRQIENAFAKLEALLNEAQRREVPFEGDWTARWENLRSRYLTDPKLIDAAWEREVKRARIISTGEDDERSE